ncbi:MAG: hypothetical protein IPK02_17625 [Candidatus Accumulibacter sp.]|uniref:Uncharacterized protein n=1 Tax=Candidatus Accumulibacter affinis TaxID=2954384 RepID=A0A935TDX3_9PROT|nr:hypothetical protein [Candidatus Accumulibacter affinis]
MFSNPRRVVHYAISASDFPMAPDVGSPAASSDAGDAVIDLHITHDRIDEGTGSSTSARPNVLCLISSESILCRAYRLAAVLEVLRPAAVLCSDSRATAPARLAGMATGTAVLLDIGVEGESTAPGHDGGPLYRAFVGAVSMLPARTASPPMVADLRSSLRRTSVNFHRLLRVTLPRLLRVVAPEHAYLSLIDASSRAREMAEQLIDRELYASQYLEGADAVDTAVAHYLAIGCHNGCRAHTLFWDDWYLGNYPDARRTGLSAWEHYWTQGARRDANPNPFFDAQWYRSRHRVDPPTNPLLHYLSLPAGATVETSPLFDARWYAVRYADLIDSEKPLLADFIGAISSTISASTVRRASITSGRSR